MPKNARRKCTLKGFQMDPDVDGTGGDGSCVNKGTWTVEEDRKLAECIEVHGPRRWNSLAMKSGLKRCGNSCRLRWLNYLRPDIKRGDISPAEDDLILRLHRLLGNRWSLIAGRLPGRTDNEIKNYWNAHLRKKAKLMDKLPATSTALHVHTEYHHHNHRHEKIAVESSSSTSRVELDNNITKLTSSGEAEQDEDYDLSSSGNGGGDDQHLFDFSARGTCGLEWVKTFLELEEHHGPS